mgnify:CR=1 FL=1
MARPLMLGYLMHAPAEAPVPDAPWQIEGDAWKVVPVNIPAGELLGALVSERCRQPVTVKPGFPRSVRAAVRRWIVDGGNPETILLKAFEKGRDWMDVMPSNMLPTFELPSGKRIHIPLSTWEWSQLRDLPIYKGMSTGVCPSYTEASLHRVARLWRDAGEEWVAERVSVTKRNHVRHRHAHKPTAEPDSVE